MDISLLSSRLKLCMMIIKNILEELKKHSHFRDLKNFEGKDEKYIYFKGKKLLNLSSNNYF